MANVQSVDGDVLRLRTLWCAAGVRVLFGGRDRRYRKGDCGIEETRPPPTWKMQSRTGQAVILANSPSMMKPLSFGFTPPQKEIVPTRMGRGVPTTASLVLFNRYIAAARGLGGDADDQHWAK